MHVIFDLKISRQKCNKLNVLSTLNKLSGLRKILKKKNKYKTNRIDLTVFLDANNTNNPLAISKFGEFRTISTYN